jgi:hypothetical protein
MMDENRDANRKSMDASERVQITYQITGAQVTWTAGFIFDLCESSPVAVVISSDCLLSNSNLLFARYISSI